MSAFKSLFKQTFIYGIATVLPRMLSFLLVPLYTNKDVISSEAEYGQVTIIFSYFVLFNVILAYGMETAFFRFYSKESDKDKVVGTSTLSLVISSLVFFLLAMLFQHQISNLIQIEVKYVQLVIWILLFDALVIIPFAWLRANQKPMRYAMIKILNVIINFGLNLFFLLWLKELAEESLFFQKIYVPDYEVSYIFISNLIASGVTFLLLGSFYFKLKFVFDLPLWKQMIKYAFPVLIAGLAFAVNETFDRILLDRLLPPDVAETQVGIYSACYKLALFMTFFVTAFKLGIEPYFFSHSNTESPQTNYAKILEIFVAFGSVILLAVVVFADFLKVLILEDPGYWEAMWIVPIILIANFFLGIYHNLSVWYKITDRTRIGGYISVTGALITLLLNFYLIPIIGYKGSALATLAAYGTMMLISYILGRKYYPIPYDLRKIVLYLVVSILFSVLAFYVFRDVIMIKIGLLIVFLAIVYYVERNQILLLLNKRD